MAKQGVIEQKGEVTEALGNATFRVEYFWKNAN